MKKVIEQYQQSYQDHGRSKEAVFIPKGRQAERYDLLLPQVHREQFSVLDFGCGLAFGYEHLSGKFDGMSYTGVDIVEDFIADNRRQFPGANFEVIQSPQEIEGEFDYVICSGVFNLVYEDVERQKAFVRDTLIHLFGRARIGLSFDFLSDQVDYMQEGAYHQNVMEIYSFCCESLSRRLVLNQSVLPYEFTINCFKPDEIVRPDHVYVTI